MDKPASNELLYRVDKPSFRWPLDYAGMKGGQEMKRVGVFVLAGMIASSIVSLAFAKEPSEFVEEFFNYVKQGKVSQGYDILLAGSGIPAMKPQAVDMLKTQTASGLPMYGKILGIEKIREEKFGISVVRLVYILKSEKAPTVWEFYFYKPQANWFLGNILFNDQFQLLEGKH